MNKQEKRKQLREALIKEIEKGTLKEGILEKLLMAFLSPMIKREVKKIKNDPEIIEAEAAVKYAVERWKDTLTRTIELEKKALEKAEKAREEYAKSRSKK